MLRVLTSLFRGRAPAVENRSVRIANGPPDAMPFPTMQPLVPPPAENDDILAGMRFEVEQELRSAGYLRSAV